MLRVERVLRADQDTPVRPPRAPARPDTGDALARLAADYTAFVADNPEIVSVLIAQTVHLPEPDRDALRRSQRAYLAEWVALVTAARPGTEAPEARVRVHAALALINGPGRVHHLAVRPGAHLRTAALAGAVLAGAPRPS